MSTKPCTCCKDKKPEPNPVANGYGYNHLSNDARTWATDHKIPRSEHCVRVKDGKRFKGPEWQRIKCGDGRMGFTMRRRNQDEVPMEVGLDGQSKKKRATLVRPRSARASSSRRARRVDGSRFSLVSSVAIATAQRDPDQLDQQRKADKKHNRSRNRNNAARRGHQRTVKMAA